ARRARFLSSSPGFTGALSCSRDHLDEHGRTVAPPRGPIDGRARGPARRGGSLPPMAPQETLDENDSDQRREIFVGCAELPPGMSRTVYFQKLRFLETRLPGDELPGERVLRRWRADAGGAGRFAIVAPRELCDLSGSLEARRADRVALADRLGRAAAELGAAAVVFPTAPEVTPSTAHRDRLRWLFEEVAPAERMGGALRVWQPDGLWRPAVAHR